MCGLTGFWDFKASSSAEELLKFVSSMAFSIQFRGPDSAGEWCDPKVGLAFGHRRLAIVDLSPAGHQPMISHSGRSVLIYNGEIFNTNDLRDRLSLEGCTFRSHSDTEVLLEACEHWGVEKTCQQLIGMFTFAFWRCDSQQLFLARDRLGIKPLYWGFHQNIFFFGSQLKTFFRHPHFKPQLNKNALTEYLRFNHVVAPSSIFEGIEQLSAGTVLCLDQHKNVHQNRFWDLDHVVRSGIECPFVGSDQEAIEALDRLLRDAVKRRMMADVPLGAFLSGGIDSSLVVALMQSQSTSPIKTFSIGFSESSYNEAPYAEAVAKHLKTDHHSLYIDAAQAQAFIPEIPFYFDEPFADSSQIPTFLVSQLARQQVTVSLSGDGGDELFAGYTRYLQGYSIWKKIAWMPQTLRTMLAYSLCAISVDTWNRLAHVLPHALSMPLLGDKLHKLATMLRSPREKDFYSTLISHWDQPKRLIVGRHFLDRHAQESDRRSRTVPFRHPTEQMQFWDTLHYLPDDILTKVDRASMAVSLEARVPLLDHRVVEFAWGLPYHLKVREGQSKWILRQVLNRYVPAHLMDRPKMGFGVPIDQWLRGPLREWAEDLLSNTRLTQEGILNPNPIRARWKEHLSGRRNWQYSLWGVLMFQAWYEHYRSRISI